MGAKKLRKLSQYRVKFMDQHDKKNNDSYFDRTRMSFGDHLMELRARLIKSIYGLAIAATICLFFTRYILAFVATPLFVALEASGHDPQLIATTVQGPFVTYIKAGLFSGIFVASPWIFYQLWGFVATGLYPHERRYVNIFMPFSAVLFVLGGLFFIVVVAPISCNFFIIFSNKLSTSDFLQDSSYRNFVTRILVSSGAEPVGQLPGPVVDGAEQGPGAGVSAPLARPLYNLTDYISLVTVLAIVFGLAFQMPLVVFFLGRLGLVEVRTFQSMRKYVLFGIFVVSALLTPPDVISQVALSLPMYVLYELGIVLLRVWPKRLIAQ